MRGLGRTEKLARTLLRNTTHKYVRMMSVEAALKGEPDHSYVERTDAEWLQAKPYDEIPGPNKWTFPLSFLPGGKYHGFGLMDLHLKMREEYGPIFKIPGMMDRLDTVFTYSGDDFERVYRTEGVWPIRIGLLSFEYYRKEKRPDVFQGLGGLVTEQGKNWADVRYKVNPVLMKTQTVRHHLPSIDVIAKEFLKRIEKIRDPNTREVPANFGDEIRQWAFESICAIALDKRLNLLSAENVDPKVMALARAMSAFFQMSYEFDVLPSFWKYYESPKFKKFMKIYDEITDITVSYIQEAKERINSQGKNKQLKSVLEKLLAVDERIAVVMAIDMLMAGIDTTSSAFTTFLYHLAKNPLRQERLRKEIMEIMPDKDTPLTQENTANMPYLRACFKESLRIKAITPGNFRCTTQDIVLSGYRIPKNVGVIMGVMVLSNDEKYFPRSLEFFPERWLKRGEDACPAARTNNPFVYLPFGFGSRTCIGKRIAEMEIETMTANIIRNYHVSWHHEDMKYVSNLINIPSGDMKFKFEDIN